LHVASLLPETGLAAVPAVLPSESGRRVAEHGPGVEIANRSAGGIHHDAAYLDAGHTRPECRRGFTLDLSVGE
jgi:hypothetical protein